MALGQSGDGSQRGSITELNIFIPVFTDSLAVSMLSSMTKVFQGACKDARSRLSLGASGEFGSHAIRPRSSHHMQVITVGILRSP